MDLKQYQKECFKKYKEVIKYPNINFFFGNPVQPLVPIETQSNGVMIIGAYPSAKFETINGVKDVPVCSNDAPFSSEKYFDGSRVRGVASGIELEELYLNPLGTSREKCWITNLVKVFLFKDGHVNKYRELSEDKFLDLTENRSMFIEYGKRGKVFIEQEIEIATPKVIICLGVEVAQVLFGISAEKSKEFMDGKIRKFSVLKDIPVLIMPHPGIIMKNNKWKEKLKEEIIPNAKIELQGLDIYEN